MSSFYADHPYLTAIAVVYAIIVLVYCFAVEHLTEDDEDGRYD
ncbi:hypothetical protein EVB31_031 [Rhizobium phage RHph_TM29]|nr:hypothetical protein EVB31_031 [Rhizobium phage RHph_TM29]